MTERYGAAPAEWDHFTEILGLGPDLLPVVSNPSARISPLSKMKALGKTPSRYNAQRLVGGIPDWTSHVTTDAEITRWKAEADYGIALQTRRVRALDCDIDDPKQSGEVFEAVAQTLGWLPCRRRGESGKFLLAFTMSGEFAKRVIRTSQGIIEFLATGQQFIAVGTHPSGAEYYWGGGLPVEIPTLTLEQFEALWSALEAKFAIEPSTTSKLTSKKQQLEQAAANDPIAVSLHDLGLVRSTERDGRLHITCPFEAEHTSDSADSATTYFPAFTGGFERGHFRCLHAHCEGRPDGAFLTALGLGHDDRDDFEATAVVFDEEHPGGSVAKAVRYAFVPALEYLGGPPPGWHIKHVLPKSELIVVYGESGSGKSFFVFDMVAAIARGESWRGHKTKKGRVVYIAAEGASGFRKRISAYCTVNDVSELDLFILPAAPNFTEGKDVTDLINSIRALGDVAVVVVDTMAQVSAGANENSGEDMGLVISHCSTIHKVTGATVVLIAHSGKDQTKGIRGWSGIKAALDMEMEITRDDENRTARISKMKDGEGEGERFGFTLPVVPIGMDGDGDLISSCVVEHCEAVAPKPKEKRLSRSLERAWQLVLDNQKPDQLGAIEDEVVDAYLALVPRTDAARDLRPRDCRRALDTLEGMQRIKRVAPNRIVIQGGAEE